MKRLSPILIVVALILAAIGADAKKVKTTRPATKSSADVAVLTDTIVGDAVSVGLSGYEKPLRANRESVFLTNHTDRAIVAISLTTAYYDTSGRAIHSATRHISDLDIPAGETRRLYFPTWDLQHTFYYVGGQQPQRIAATPYDVRQRVDTLFVVSNSN